METTVACLRAVCSLVRIGAARSASGCCGGGFLCIANERSTQQAARSQEFTASGFELRRPRIQYCDSKLPPIADACSRLQEDSPSACVKAPIAVVDSTAAAAPPLSCHSVDAPLPTTN